MRDAALDHDITLWTEEEEVFGVVAPDQNKPVPRADRCRFQHLQPAAAVRAGDTTEAEPAEHPGQDGNEAQHQQQGQDKSEIGVELHHWIQVEWVIWPTACALFPVLGRRAIGKLRAQAPVGLLQVQGQVDIAPTQGIVEMVKFAHQGFKRGPQGP